jgi:hypothetical protein
VKRKLSQTLGSRKLKAEERSDPAQCYTKLMQKIATRIFIYASVVFGIVGILIVLTASGPDQPDTTLSQVLIRLLFIDVFIILPSFALSLAGKYLNGKF